MGYFYAYMSELCDMAHSYVNESNRVA